MKYIDTHSHLYFKDFDHDRSEVIKRTVKQGIGVINIGTNVETSNKAVNLTFDNKNFYATVGVHPTVIEEIEAKVLKDDLRNLIKNEKVVAVGECGLDYFRIPHDTQEYKNKQKEIFELQIELALENNLPLMIHCRDAYEEVLSILNHYKKRTETKKDHYCGKKLRGNFHFFAGSVNVLKEVLALGFTVSYTGVITFAAQYKELVENTPIDMMHIESDAPFVAPTPHRGKRNEPIFCVEVFKKIADIKKVSHSKLQKQLLKNAKDLYGIVDKSLLFGKYW